MFRLRMPTDPRWANVAEGNIQEILTDHAFCEQKAASSAITIIVKYPEYTDLVKAMSDLVIEEMEHFRMVHEKIVARGWSLGHERKDDYVGQLMKFFKGGNSRERRLVDKLLLGAMIEARSCERFRVFSENVKDKELAEFYRELMVSEANHYTLFLNFARKYGEGVCDVDKLWQEFLDYEATVIQSYGTTERIHG